MGGAFLVDNLAQTAIVPRLFLPPQAGGNWFMLICTANSLANITRFGSSF
ncbi:hypothetical protein SOHN41_01422 [Shewanella sp. HN-41]|nr:hypothetical protein SOHN41_01422 [Shewanella sp. HN-41]